MSLLKAALEGELVGQQENPAPQASEKEMLELKGPLSEVFSQALQKAYARPTSSDAPESGVATESQANDALAIAQLVNDMEMANAATPSDGNSTTVYGVAANDVKPEDIVEVSQDLAEGADNFAIVMDATQPSVNGSDSSAPSERVEYFAKALEALAEAYGVKVFPSLEAFAADWVAKKQIATEAKKEPSAEERAEQKKFNALSFKISDHAVAIAKRIDKALKAGYKVRFGRGPKESVCVYVSGKNPAGGPAIENMAGTEYND
jgi:hypothetical protein